MGNETTFTYTPLGNIETLTNALGATIQYEYYPGGQLKSMILPEGEIETYRYDENGNVIEKQVGKGEFYRYEYDELDRMIRRTNPLGTQVHFTKGTQKLLELNQRNLVIQIINKLTSLSEVSIFED